MKDGHRILNRDCITACIAALVMFICVCWGYQTSDRSFLSCDASSLQHLGSMCLKKDPADSFLGATQKET